MFTPWVTYAANPVYGLRYTSSVTLVTHTLWEVNVDNILLRKCPGGTCPALLKSTVDSDQVSEFPLLQTIWPVNEKYKVSVTSQPSPLPSLGKGDGFWWGYPSFYTGLFGVRNH